ncbi:conserved unknown protein [Ectocarpus siliculosus]|uniref:tRNA-uridine aminocarboxypropyltransferase 1 n=1 Tax=Ectocarpus siliculosus TaxID=2880 RepID=D8LC29_ECTSI|nr:conserved unknown protein [Ectocarpus siliculosus]|eukprot:CBN79212.1 conserved unknown protein [Ectocarpus siliculosus]
MERRSRGASAMEEYLERPPDINLWPQGRQECHRCGKRVRLYCPDCLILVGTPDGVETPTELRLPLQVDVVVTAEERRRSSGVHVAVMAPQSVRVVSFEGSGGDDLSSCSYRPESDFVVFPSAASVCWSELSEEDLARVRRVILIDSRWVNTGAVVGHPKLKGLRHVRIREPPAVSQFWRWHTEGEGHICTAEATYLVLKDFEEATGLVTRGGRLEDILFLFALMGSRIKAAYESDPSKLGKSCPSSEEAKQRRRVRLVQLDRLVKAKYKGLDALRERDGDEAAIEEFFRRRRGESVYDAASTTSASLAQQPVGDCTEQGEVAELREPSTTTEENRSGENSSDRIL